MAKSGSRATSEATLGQTRTMVCHEDLVLAEVLGLDVYWVRLPADRVNLLLTTLVGVDSAEEKENLARLA
jgi:hypothetical protein